MASSRVSKGATDRLARRMAGAALGLAVLGVALAAYAVHLGSQYLHDVRTLGRTIERNLSPEELPLHRPPPQLVD